MLSRRFNHRQSPWRRRYRIRTMQISTVPEPLNAAGIIITGKKTRPRRPLPSQETRDWLTPNETALALGCSLATVHRLRRGLIRGIPPLPCSQYGRKCVFRKLSIALWQDSVERKGPG